jgi:hypothetical protein
MMLNSFSILTWCRGEAFLARSRFIANLFNIKMLRPYGKPYFLTITSIKSLLRLVKSVLNQGDCLHVCLISGKKAIMRIL